MKININHPTFILFLDNMTNNILSHVSTNSYFLLSQDKKLSLQYTIFQIMKNSLKTGASLSDNEFKSFIIVLKNKNEELENYELAEILKDIINNFDSINNSPKITKKSSSTTKTDKTK